MKKGEEDLEVRVRGVEEGWAEQEGQEGRLLPRREGLLSHSF